MDETLTEVVLRTVELVPPGRLVSYGDVVALLGTGPRQVGAVMAREGHGVQWWRVTNASGDLPPHLMADAARHWATEGITLKPNGWGARISQSHQPVPGGPGQVGRRLPRRDGGPAGAAVRGGRSRLVPRTSRQLDVSGAGPRPGSPHGRPAHTSTGASSASGRIWIRSSPAPARSAAVMRHSRPLNHGVADQPLAVPGKRRVALPADDERAVGGALTVTSAAANATLRRRVPGHMWRARSRPPPRPDGPRRRRE